MHVEGANKCKTFSLDWRRLEADQPEKQCELIIFTLILLFLIVRVKNGRRNKFQRPPTRSLKSAYASAKEMLLSLVGFADLLAAIETISFIYVVEDVLLRDRPDGRLFDTHEEVAPLSKLTNLAPGMVEAANSALW